MTPMTALVLATPVAPAWMATGMVLASVVGLVALVIANLPVQTRTRERIVVALIVVAGVLGLAHSASANVLMQCDWMGCWFDSIFW